MDVIRAILSRCSMLQLSEGRGYAMGCQKYVTLIRGHDLLLQSPAILYRWLNQLMEGRHKNFEQYILHVQKGSNNSIFKATVLIVKVTIYISRHLVHHRSGLCAIQVEKIVLATLQEGHFWLWASELLCCWSR